MSSFMHTYLLVSHAVLITIFLAAFAFYAYRTVWFIKLMESVKRDRNPKKLLDALASNKIVIRKARITFSEEALSGVCGHIKLDRSYTDTLFIFGENITKYPSKYNMSEQEVKYVITQIIENYTKN